MTTVKILEYLDFSLETTNAGEKISYEINRCNKTHIAKSYNFTNHDSIDLLEQNIIANENENKGRGPIVMCIEDPNLIKIPPMIGKSKGLGGPKLLFNIKVCKSKKCSKELK